MSFQTRIQYYANSRRQRPADLQRNADYHVPIADAHMAERRMYEHVLSYPDQPAAVDGPLPEASDAFPPTSSAAVKGATRD